LIHAKSDLNIQVLRERFGARLTNTQASQSWPRNPEWHGILNPIKRYRVTRDRQEALSRDFDVFVVVTHDLPPFAAGKLNILHVLFPYVSPYTRARRRVNGAEWKARISTPARELYFRYELRQRLKNYGVLSAISRFAASWSQKRWLHDGPWEIWYPPVSLVPTRHDAGARNGIVTVGRIIPQKLPLAMIGWFREATEGIAGYPLRIAGATDQVHNGHRDELKAAGAGLDVRIMTDLFLSELHDVYGSSSIYWHCHGFGAPDSQPEDFEHFGMTTVEAMSAGCVPVVFGKGGQAEIVEHGVNGFVWTEPKELIDYTRRLLEDRQLLSQMSAAAVARSAMFGKQAFCDRLEATVRARFDSA
jgi:glycosyltransferase involved in cell wall biosynthesis